MTRIPTAAAILATVMAVASAQEATTQPAGDEAAEPQAPAEAAPELDTSDPVIKKVIFLTRALGDPRWRHRDNVARELGHIGPKAASAIGALIASASDKDWRLRRECILALRKIDPDGGKSAEVFAAALQDKDQWVRIAAAEAAGQTGNVQAALVVLLKAARDQSRSVRLEAILAIGRIGPPARTAAKTLNDESRAERSTIIRKAAEWALRRIGAGHMLAEE